MTHTPHLEIYLEEKSIFNHFTYQNEAPSTNFLGQHKINLSASSEYYSYALQQGARAATLIKKIIFNQPLATARLYGLYLVSKDQVIDNIINVQHRVPECESEQLFKGVLKDNGKSGFTGKVTVARDAQNTLSNQLNNTLILGGDAMMQSRPQLEILADDVKCNHGSTIGRINEEEIYYLMSRGIPFDTTQLLLADSFLGDFYHAAEKRFPKIKHLIESR